MQVADLHLSRARSYTQAGWEACLRHINEARPDLVVFAGDQVQDDPDDADDQLFARRQLERTQAPWVALPGNHDIGDDGPAPHMEQAITPSRLAAWTRINGPDRWTRELGRWRVIGLNAMLAGGILVENEKDQLDWLDTVIADDRKRPLIIFIHKPFYLHHRNEEIDSEYLVERPGREALLARLARGNVRLIASGHAHHRRVVTIDSVPQVWAPSAALLGKTPSISFGGDPSPGLVRFLLDDSGDTRFEFVAPEGLAAFDATDLRRVYGTMRFAPPFAQDRGCGSIVSPSSSSSSTTGIA